MNDQIHTSIIAQFEKQGTKQVRMLFPTYSGPLRTQAEAWLRHKDEEAEQSNKEAVSRACAAAERAASAAERQADAAESANKRATIALIIATISMAATIGGIWVTHKNIKRNP
jgi:hypothetical protein